MTPSTRSALSAPWLPPLPSHWSTAALGRLVQIRNGRDYKDVEVEAGGFPVYGSGGVFRRSSAFLYDGTSILFGRKGTIDRPLLVHGKFWTVDTMFYTEIGDQIDSRFLSRYASAIPFDYYSTGTALPSMTQNDLSKYVVPVPPLSEQVAIADFLDRETARIDTLIAKQQQLIETLRERRAAVISSRVLAGRMPLQDRQGFVSLRNWWDVSLGKMLDAGRVPRADDVELPYLRAANVQPSGLDLSSINHMPFNPAEVKELDLRRGDVLVVEGGAGVGNAVSLDRDLPGWSFQKTLNRIRPRGGASSEFLVLLLRAYRDGGVLDIVSNKSTIPHLTAEKLLALPVPDITFDMQREVVRDVSRFAPQIDALTAKAQGLIKLAKERRDAVITAAVTGQIDVSKAA